MHLPPKKYSDLRRYVILRDVRRLACYIAWLAVFFLGAIGYNQSHQTYPEEQKILGWRLFVWMMIGAILGCFIFRIWKLFLMPYRRGKVLRSGMTNTYTPGEDPGLVNKVSYDFRLKNKLLMQGENGKKFRLAFEQKTGSYVYYTEGKTLVRYHGLPYPVDTDPTSTGGYVCAACGRMHPQLVDVCGQCGLSLIDPKDVESSAVM